MEKYYVYILHSNKLNRNYIGSTSNISQRIEFHLSSKDKFTSKTKDWELIFKIECKSKEQALEIEKHIKKMKSSIYINNLKKYPEMTQKLLQKYC